MQSKLSNKKLFLLTCKDYPLGNIALQGLLERLNTFCEAKFCVWQEVQSLKLNENYIILPLAVWDYTLFYEEFLAFLKECEKSGAKSFNPYELLRINSKKTYLKILENKGFKVPKSLFLKENQKELWQEQILKFKKDFKLKELIIKPLVGQSGRGVLKFENLEELNLKEFKEALVQEFITQAFDGEFCLIFFDNKFSHAICRKPPKNEYRANSAYGVEILPFLPSKELIKKGLKALQVFDFKSLYARVDFLKNENKFVINEIEFIEPSLYFNFEENSYKNFIKALENLS